MKLNDLYNEKIGDNPDRQKFRKGSIYHAIPPCISESFNADKPKFRAGSIINASTPKLLKLDDKTPKDSDANAAKSPLLKKVVSVAVPVE